MLRFLAIYVFLSLCLFCRAEDESFVDHAASFIDNMPETAVYEQEMEDLHKRAVESVRNYLKKQMQVQLDAKNYTKAAELETRIAHLEDELKDVEIGEAPANVKTFMDGRKWKSTKKQAVYTVQNGTLYCNGSNVGALKVISPSVLCAEEQQKLWIWYSDTEALCIDSICLSHTSAQGEILKSVNSSGGNDRDCTDVDKIVLERYQNYMHKNMPPIRRKYVKALTKQMEIYATNGNVKEAAKIQTYIASLPKHTANTAKNVSSTPRSTSNANDRLVGKFVEIIGGTWIYTFSPQGWKTAPSNASNSLETSKFVEKSPDNCVFVYHHAKDIEHIFWYNDKLVRVVRSPRHASFLVRVLQRIK